MSNSYRCWTEWIKKDDPHNVKHICTKWRGHDPLTDHLCGCGDTVSVVVPSAEPPKVTCTRFWGTRQPHSIDDGHGKTWDFEINIQHSCVGVPDHYAKPHLCECGEALAE